MKGKERVKIALDYKEADKVPMLKVTAGNKLAREVLGRPANIFFSGLLQREPIKF